MIIQYQQAKEILYCSKGMRAWFVQHNLDYFDFVKNGIDSEILAQLNDPFADRLLEHAKEGGNG